MPIDKDLYKKVKKMADKRFLAPTSIYKSSWIVKEYKKRGGKYKGKKSNSKGLKRWYKEEWVDLNRPIKKNGKVIGYRKCGRKSIKSGEKYPLCRPRKRVTSSTPRTVKEISKKSINRAKREKSKIKHTGNVQFGGRAQYRGKKSSIMIQVPQNVKKWAQYAFKLKKIGFQGATNTGWLRAKQLATKDTIPIEDLRYMRNWYARHIVTSYPGFKKWLDAGRPKDEKWHKKRAIQSWVTWGGNAGLKWVNSKKVINLLNKHFNKNYKIINSL